MFRSGSDGWLRIRRRLADPMKLTAPRVFVLALLTPACTGKTPEGHPGRDDTAADSGDTNDTGVPAGPGIVVLAGGGAEGEADDMTAWSARLYPHLWEGGDVTGDGRVRVAIVSVEEEDEWLPDYFEILGADEAFNVRVSNRDEAEDDALVDTFAQVDAVFLKGGDQGQYYDRWNDSVLEAQLRLVHETRGGGTGGTSAGAMSQAQFALAGGSDLVSEDVLEDAETPYLDDTDGGSGIHDDFLGFVPGYVVDTHFTQRGRLGRLVGAMGKALVDLDLPAVFGLGCEEETGVWIRDGRAEVVGVGAVSLVTADGSTLPQRASGVPLTWQGLRLDRLTDGWAFDVATGEVDTAAPPPGAEAVTWDGTPGPTAGEWYADGDWLDHEERFEWVVTRDPDAYSEHAGADVPVLSDAIGVVDAFDSARRGPAEEALFRGLYDHVGATGVMLGYGGSAVRDDAHPAVIQFVDNPEVDDPPMASMLVNTSTVTWRSLAPTPSLCDLGDGSLHAAGLVGVTLHVLYTPASLLAYNTAERVVTPVAELASGTPAPPGSPHSSRHSTGRCFMQSDGAEAHEAGVSAWQPPVPGSAHQLE